VGLGGPAPLKGPRLVFAAAETHHVISCKHVDTDKSGGPLRGRPGVPFQAGGALDRWKRRA